MGISVGPWLAGIALTAGLGYPAVPWLGSGLAALALSLLALDIAIAKPTSRRVNQQVTATEPVRCG